MRIGVLGPFPPFRGGIATFDYHLVRALARHGEALAINYRNLYPSFIFPGTSQLDQSEQPFSQESRALFDPFHPWRWRRGRRELDQLDLDVLLLSWWTPIFAPSMMRFLRKWAKQPGRLLAIICHNVLPHESFPLEERLQRALLRRADILVTHWQGDRARLQQWFPDKRVLSLFHPVYHDFPDTPLSRAEARQRLGIPEHAGRVLLFFGLIRPYKGLAVLLEAFARLLERRDDVSLVVAGEFYEPQSEYRELLEPLERRGRLVVHDHFIPNEKVCLYFRAADGVVLPYRHATQSGIVPLAYAWQRGVIVTDVGGLAEMVEPGRSGIVAPPDDMNALVEAMDCFLKDQERIEQGVADVAARFGWDRYVSAILQEVAEKSGTK